MSFIYSELHLRKMALYLQCLTCFKLPEAMKPKSLYIKGDLVTWIRPVTMKELLEVKMKYPQAKMVIGNTEIGECIQV